MAEELNGCHSPPVNAYEYDIAGVRPLSFKRLQVRQ
jgi:hypothetical protein